MQRRTTTPQRAPPQDKVSDSKNRTITVGMAQLTGIEDIFEDGEPGLMVDNVAPYFGMGLI